MHRAFDTRNASRWVIHTDMHAPCTRPDTGRVAPPPSAQEFDGRWVVEPGSSGGGPVTTLRYEISVVPKFSIPSAALVHVIRSGLPANMQAIALRAEQVRPVPHQTTPNQCTPSSAACP